MKVKDITRQIEDSRLFIKLENTEKEESKNIGYFTKKDLYYNDKLQNMTVKEINAQYINYKRILVLEVQ